MKLNLLGRVLSVFVCGLTGISGALSASESVTLSQGDIQSLVYKSHLLTLLDERPELEAGLILLFEMDRRNPGDSNQIVQALQKALKGYRAHYLDMSVYPLPRDVILASFVEYMVKNVDMGNLRPATLTVLNLLMQESYTATTGTSIRAHAGNYQILDAEHALERQEECIDKVLLRAQSVPGFSHMLDRVMEGETNVSVKHTPDRIIELNPVLSQSPTMSFLARRYKTASTGPLEVSTGELETLFKLEMAIIKETISTNQNLLKELELEQGELTTYLLDENHIAQQQAYQAKTREGQYERISASSAAAHAISYSMRSAKPDTAKHMRTVATSMKSFAKGLELLDSASKFGKMASCTNFLSAGLGLASFFIDIFNTGPSPEEIILEEINALKEMIQDLATHIDYRFDRVDKTLNVVLEQLDYSIQLIGEVGRDVDEVRLDLLDVQAGLCRLEREVFNYLDAGFRRDFKLRLNGDLRYEMLNNELMTWDWYKDIAENEFYTWAVTTSVDKLSSYRPDPTELTDSNLESGLGARPLESNLNYINEFLATRLGVAPLSTNYVPNPRDWFAGADAYLKLAVENPLHFRRKHWSRVDDVISVGRDLEDFFGAFSIVGDSKPNTKLFDAVLDYYGSKLDKFLIAADEEKLFYAQTEMGGFDYAMWSEWDRQCTEQLIDEAAITGLVNAVRLPTDIIQVATGGNHSLALRSDGTVIGWGANYEGETDIPEGLTNVIAIEAGGGHSIALKSDGTVLAWGANYYDQCAVPAGLSNVVAIAAGPHHNLALRGDGTVVSWGYMSDSIVQVPIGLTNVVQIATGGDTNRDTGLFCLALKADGKVVAWGTNRYGECDVPQALVDGQLDVVQIAGTAAQAAAVLADGSVIAWPNPLSFSKEITELSMFNGGYAVGLGVDGTVEVVSGEPAGAPVTNDVVQVAAGSTHAVALHEDGQLSIWGSERYGLQGFGSERSIVDVAGNRYMLLFLFDDGSVKAVATGYSALPEQPMDLPPLIAITVGRRYKEQWCLGLTAEGTVVAWGSNAQGQCDVPADLTDVVAISAPNCSDGGHSLALRKDGTVVGWGDNSFGQRNPPSGLDNAVAIAAGWRHSAALRSDGTVVTWGDNHYGQQNIPSGLDNVVAISSRRSHVLALKADGTVVAWGENGSGQRNVPADLTDVIAVEAGDDRSLALKADGSVVAWGENEYGAVDLANSQTGVLKMVNGGSYIDHFMKVNNSLSNEPAEPFAYHPRMRPTAAVSTEFAELYGYVLYEYDHDLNDPVSELMGSKHLLDAVISLALPYSMEQDDALRGFLLGSEALPDRDSSHGFYEGEIAYLQSNLWARPHDLDAMLQARLPVFSARLYDCLKVVVKKGKPEIPRMVSHTLSMLEILRAAHFEGQTPTPVFGMADAGLSSTEIAVPLYGEPYIHYSLEETNNPVSWTATGEILHNGDSVLADPDNLDRATFFRVIVQ